jgi:hypothetical protein
MDVAFTPTSHFLKSPGATAPAVKFPPLQSDSTQPTPIPSGGDVYYLSSCATGRITRILGRSLLSLFPHQSPPLPDLSYQNIVGALFPIECVRKRIEDCATSFFIPIYHTIKSHFANPEYGAS